MKRRGFWGVLSLAFCLVLLSGCQKAAEDTNRAAVPSPTAETIDKAAIETELLRLENDWPRILKEKDLEAVKRVEADDAVFVYPDGNVGDKNTDVKDMESGALSLDSLEVLDLKVNVLNKDAAIVTGRTVVKNGKYKLADGKSIDISGQYRFIDTFARRDGQWKLVAGASAPVREPPAAAPSPVVKASPAVAPSPSMTTPPPVKPLQPVRIVPPRARMSPAMKPTP